MAEWKHSAVMTLSIRDRTLLILRLWFELSFEFFNSEWHERAVFLQRREACV